jgi:hypothetical protein
MGLERTGWRRLSRILEEGLSKHANKNRNHKEKGRTDLTT